MYQPGQTYTYHFPTLIRFGEGVVGELPGHLKERGIQKPLVVTDPNVFQLGFFRSIIDMLEKAGLKTEVFSEIHANPVKSDVLKGGRIFHHSRCDAIIGIGGGAAMDVARAIALHVYHPRDLFDYDELIGGDKLITENIPCFVTVPTTSGTGSEVGRSAIISEDDTRKKRILFHPRLMAKCVFADPVLTFNLPPQITAATGMDALTHHIEACLAKGYHPMCEGIALEGIRIIAQALPGAVNRPDPKNRGEMMIAALMGAVAFQKGLGIVHSLAHPLSTLLDMHHGLANAIMLPYGMQFNLKGMEDKFSRMCAAANTNAHKPEEFIEWLFNLDEEIGITPRLSAYGVDESHLETLADLAIQDFCHPNNPKPVTREDFLQIYKQAL